MKLLPILAVLLLVCAFPVLATITDADITFYDNAETGVPFDNGWYYGAGAGSGELYQSNTAANGTRSLNFTGTGGEVKHLLRNMTYNSTTGTTLDLWFYDTGLAFEIFGIGDGGSVDYVAFERNTGVNAFNYTYNRGDDVTRTSNVSFSSGWHHAAMFINGSKTGVIMLLDNTTVFDGAVNVTPLASTIDLFFVLGGDVVVDDVRIYNGAPNFSVSPAPNTSPVLVSVAQSVTSNNLTIMVSANATDPDNATIRYNTTINRSGTLEYLNYSGFVAANLTVQYLNYSVTQAGNYSVCAIADDGAFSSAMICTGFDEITFPVPPPNVPPVTRSVSAVLSADNLTLIVSANATDTDNATVRYLSSINISGSTSSLGYSGYVAQGVTVQFLNYSVTADGNYSVCVIANDGVNDSTTQQCTSFVEATFAVVPPEPPADPSGVIMLIASMIALVFLMFFAYPFVTQNETSKKAFWLIIGVIGIAVVVALLSLLL